MVATNVRHPHDFMGDLRAMIGSARVGERRLLALLDEYGPKTVAGAVEEILDGAERQARECVRSWTDGVYHGETILDDDGHGTTDIWICASPFFVTVARIQMSVVPWPSSSRIVSPW